MYNTGVCFTEITSGEAEKINSVKQVRFPQTVVTINTYYIFSELKILLQVVFKLVYGYVLQMQHKRVQVKCIELCI